jgi:molybdopterin-guanine dinucleotide biosynthesis protein A
MITIVIQAGGQSKRMARDKALIPFLGIPMIKRIESRFNNLGNEMLIISNNPAAINSFALPVYSDIIPERGALGGLYTALSVVSTPLIGLVAVDLPFASPALIQHLANKITEKDLDACLPSSPHGPEPLHAVYRVESCLPLVKQAIDQDLWRMNSWHKWANIEVLESNEIYGITDCEFTFLNLNTPEDLAEAEALAQGDQGSGC